MNNMQQRIILAVAAAWFAQPSYADKVTSTWTRTRSGSQNGVDSLEKSLHAQLKHHVHNNDRDLEQAEEIFIGPGVMQCSNAICSFEVDPSLGCTDPCHTQYAPRRYEYPFKSFSTVGDPKYSDSSEEELCYYETATDINTWSPELAVIEDGCTARCTGCTFAGPIVSVSGPSKLQCNEGRCTKYVHGESLECGAAIQAASTSYGFLSTLPNGESIPHEFYGFEDINGSFEIPESCSLECTGCTSFPIDAGTTKTATTETTTVNTAPTESESTSSTTPITESTSTSTTSPASDTTTFTTEISTTISTSENTTPSAPDTTTSSTSSERTTTSTGKLTFSSTDITGTILPFIGTESTSSTSSTSEIDKPSTSTSSTALDATTSTSSKVDTSSTMPTTEPPEEVTESTSFNNGELYLRGRNLRHRNNR